MNNSPRNPLEIPDDYNPAPIPIDTPTSALIARFTLTFQSFGYIAREVIKSVDAFHRDQLLGVLLDVATIYQPRLTEWSAAIDDPAWQLLDAAIHEVDALFNTVARSYLPPVDLPGDLYFRYICTRDNVFDAVYTLRAKLARVQWERLHG